MIAPDRNQRLSLIGAPVGVGAGVAGAEAGPAALRNAGLAARLVSLGHAVTDRLDVAIDRGCAARTGDGAARCAEVIAWVRAIDLAVAAALAGGTLPILIGGDHSVAMGSVPAVARHEAARGRDLLVVWLDAHADFNTPATSLSGNMHGVPAAAICGLFALEAAADPVMSVKPHDLHLVGVRSTDDAERVLLAGAGVQVIGMDAIAARGVPATIGAIIDRAIAVEAAIHVSLDADFLDPGAAPGVGTPVEAGASLAEAMMICRMLAACGRVVSIDIVELNPGLDIGGRTALALLDLVAALLGEREGERQ